MVLGGAVGTALAPETAGVSEVLVLFGGGAGAYLGAESMSENFASLFDACTGNAAQIREDLENIAVVLGKELYNAQQAGQATIEIRITTDPWAGLVVVIGEQVVSVTEETAQWLRDQGYDW